ncbi:unnamed protein product, partial [Staurois parvus]
VNPVLSGLHLIKASTRPASLTIVFKKTLSYPSLSVEPFLSLSLVMVLKSPPKTTCRDIKRKGLILVKRHFLSHLVWGP